jgi:hypothetical protein
MTLSTRACQSGCFALLLASAAGAQSTIARWEFNAASATLNPPSAGAGTMALIGGTTFLSNVGSPNDTGVPNQAINTTTYPAQGVGSGTAGVEFAVPTSGFSGVRFQFDQRHSNTSSRFVQVLYSTDGTNFQPAPGVQADPGLTTPSFAGVFASDAGDTWYFGRAIDFTGIAGVDNNPNFKVRVVSVFEPATTAYRASRSTSTYAGTGTLRYDLVTFTGTAIASIPPQGAGVASPAAICRGGTSTITVSTAPGQNPSSTGITVTADLTSIGGPANASLTDNGDGTFSITAAPTPASAAGAKQIPFTVSDAQGRSSTGSAALSVGDCDFASTAPVVISAVYGGGGNNGAPLNADFIELHNRSCNPVSLDGWSVQYAAAGGTNQFTANQQVILSGSIAAGGFLLIQTSRPDATSQGLPLPTPDVLAFDPSDPEDNGFGMGATAGRVALVASTSLLTSACGGAEIIDLVGYGLQASCFEGVAATENLASSFQAARKQMGCQDSNQTFNDFEVVFVSDPRNSASAPLICLECGPSCTQDYNASGSLDGDDLADFIADFFDSIGLQVGFAEPIAIPGGFAGNATLPFTGFGRPCPAAADVPQPNPWAAPVDGYRTGGYKVGVGLNNAPCTPPNGDDLADYIGIFFNGCP